MFEANETTIVFWLDKLTWFDAGVGVLSTILNIITVWVFSGMEPRRYPTYALFICIALADIVNGINAVLTLFVYKTCGHTQKLLCAILGPLTMTVRMTLDYLTILSVGRLTAIAFPFHFRTIFSFRKTMFYVMTCLLFSFTQYVFVPASGGHFAPLDYGWCAPRINWSSNSTVHIYTITLDMFPIVFNSVICITCFISSMVLLRKSRSSKNAVHNTERDKSIRILSYMLIAFIVCYSAWIVLEVMGALDNMGIYIGPDSNPSCKIKLMYKLMLTGVFTNGVFNALFLLRGSGKLKIKSVFSCLTKSTTKATKTTAKTATTTIQGNL